MDRYAVMEWTRLAIFMALSAWFDLRRFMSSRQVSGLLPGLAVAYVEEMFSAGRAKAGVMTTSFVIYCGALLADRCNARTTDCGGKATQLESVSRKN